MESSGAAVSDRRYSLEVKLPGELDDSRPAQRIDRTHRRQSSETVAAHRRGQIDNLTCSRVDLSGGVEGAPIGMVEHIVGFHSELDVMLRIFAVFKLLEQRYVPIADARSAHAVNSGIIANATLRRSCNARRVDESESA